MLASWPSPVNAQGIAWPGCTTSLRLAVIGLAILHVWSSTSEQRDGREACALLPPSAPRLRMQPLGLLRSPRPLQSSLERLPADRLCWSVHACAHARSCNHTSHPHGHSWRVVQCRPRAWSDSRNAMRNQVTLGLATEPRWRGPFPHRTRPEGATIRWSEPEGRPYVQSAGTGRPMITACYVGSLILHQ